MRILFVNQYFWPDMAATAQLLSDLTEDLAARGHQVGVIAGRGWYSQAQPRALPRTEVRGRVVIRRISTSDRSAASVVGRVRQQLRFLAGAAITTMRWSWDSGSSNVQAGAAVDSDVPVLVCLSTPPFLSLLAPLARIRGWRFVQKMEDLYPDIAVALGVVRRDSVATAVFRMLSGLLARATDATVVLDDAMKSRLNPRQGGICVIPNWADGHAIAPDTEAGAAFRAAHGLSERFVILYSGNLGLAHRFDALLEAAPSLLRTRPEVLFLFVGGGPRLREVADTATRIPNIRVLPYQPRERLRALYNAGDVHLVSLQDEVSGMLVPSKYAAALAAGRPVFLLGGDGSDLQEEIRRRRVGWVCAHRIDDILRTIDEVVAAREAVRAAGTRARELFETKYTREAAVDRWEAILRHVAKNQLQSGHSTLL